MKTLSSKEFDNRWQKAVKHPGKVELKCKSVKPDITMTAVLDRFLKMIDSSVAQHTIEPGLQKEIDEAAANFRKVLAKVPEKKLKLSR